jgi:hypothetical protein
MGYWVIQSAAPSGGTRRQFFLGPMESREEAEDWVRKSIAVECSFCALTFAVYDTDSMELLLSAADATRH